MRLACVYAPQLALQAILRRDPELRQDAAVLVAPPAAAGRAASERTLVLALTRAAHQAGIRRGMKLSEAKNVGLNTGLKELRVVIAVPADTAAAKAALADVGYAYASGVEEENERIFFEVGDLGRLFPDERAVAQAVVAHAARVGLAVRVAIASSKAVARVGSQAKDVALVPDHHLDAHSGHLHEANARLRARAFLAPLPIREALSAPALEEHAAALAEALERWGIHTLGALAALPATEVGLRLGDAGMRLWKIAAATLDEPFAPKLPDDALEEGTELEYAIYELEPLAFILRGLLDRAMARLGCRGLGCSGLTLRLKLEPRGCEVREIPLAAPTRESGTLLQLVRLELARRPPSGPVVGLALLVLPARVRAMQLDFLRPAGPAPERLAATMARLAALVGLENVGVAMEVDTYKEEELAVQPFSAAGARGTKEKTRAAKANITPAAVVAPALAFRRFRPPHALEVLMGREGPVALRGKDTTANVVVAAGPYHASGDWWSGDGWSRDYWDVQASDGAVYRVHQNRRDGCWYLDGYYD